MITKRYDLVLSKPLNNKNPINLVFGDDSEEPSYREHIVEAIVDLYEFSLFSSVIVDYGINQNLVGSSHDITILKANNAKNTFQLLFHESLKLDQSFFSLFEEATLIKWEYCTSWNSSDKIEDRFLSHWAQASYIHSVDFRPSFYNSDKKSSSSGAHWSAANYLFFNRHPFFFYADVAHTSNRGKFSGSSCVRIKFDALWNIADIFTRKKNIIWNFASLPGGCDPSIRPPIVPPKPPKPDVISVKADLVFCKHLNNKIPINLVFGDGCDVKDGDYSIPEKGVYIVKNEVEIFRTDDGRIIKAFNVEIGSNSKEYLWSGSLSLPLSELKKVADKPEIEININQLKFIVDVNDVDTKKGFNTGTVDISISSTTNRLKTIKAHDIGHDAGSIAIMSAQLSRDDLETGFVFLNKDGEDWVIQTGLVEYDDASSLDVINTIALSVGDIVISHAHKKEVMMKSKYPTEQPVYSVPIGKLFDLSTNEAESIKYNAIVVTGENSGITAVARKDGTSGDKIAPMIVNKLITAENAARRAAINSIYNTDDYAVSIDTESVLFKEVPMIYPRDVVKIGNDIGWVDDIRISATLDVKVLTVRHTMSIEKKIV